MRYLIILLFLFISCQLHAQNDFLEKDTVDEAHTDIDAKNELIKTKSTNISSGIFRINVVNNTGSQINIFVNKKFAFKLFVKKNGGYGVYKANDFAIVGKSIIYARTENNKRQWGPIEVDDTYDGFTWEIND